MLTASPILTFHHVLVNIGDKFVGVRNNYVCAYWELGLGVGIQYLIKVVQERRDAP